jgi:hypothetical protein
MTQDIDGIDQLIAVHGSWSPQDLAYIEDLEIRSTAMTTTVTIAALAQRRTRDGPWPDDAASFTGVRLVFHDVTDLRIAGIGGGRTQLIAFTIDDIGDRGWEGVAYEVYDDESDRLSFRCRSISVASVDESRRPLA